MSEVAGPADPSVPDVPIELLLGAPEQVQVDGNTLVLETELWRDFQPFAPPVGWGLIAMALMSYADSLSLPAEVDLGYVWVLNDSEVWAAAFTGPDPPGWPDYMRVRTARDGPKWGPFIHVDVVVGVLIGDEEMLLLAAREQWIRRTD